MHCFRCRGAAAPVGGSCAPASGAGITAEPRRRRRGPRSGGGKARDRSVKASSLEETLRQRRQRILVTILPPNIFSTDVAVGTGHSFGGPGELPCLSFWQILAPVFSSSCSLESRGTVLAGTCKHTYMYTCTAGTLMPQIPSLQLPCSRGSSPACHTDIAQPSWVGPPPPDTHYSGPDPHLSSQARPGPPHRSSRYLRYSEQSCWVPGLNQGVQDAERKFSGEMAGLWGQAGTGRSGAQEAQLCAPSHPHTKLSHSSCQPPLVAQPRAGAGTMEAKTPQGAVGITFPLLHHSGHCVQALKCHQCPPLLCPSCIASFLPLFPICVPSVTCTCTAFPVSGDKAEAGVGEGGVLLLHP